MSHENVQDVMAINSIRGFIRDEQSLGRLAAPLWARVGTLLKVDDLSWARNLLGIDGDRKLWSALQAVNALQGKPPVLKAAPLSTFLEELVQGQSERDNVVPGQLVWTLPSVHPAAPNDGRTYARSVAHVISTAQSHLVIVSPFLEAKGIGLMYKDLLRAFSRGVSIKLITHDVNNLGSLHSQALESLRRGAKRVLGSLEIYTASVVDERPRATRTLIHAKLVIADFSTLVLGSANLTGPGLSTNFEAGVTLGADAAREAMALVTDLMSTDFVKLAYAASPDIR